MTAPVRKPKKILDKSGTAIKKDFLFGLRTLSISQL
jgi:hypothetical protein